MASCTSRIIFSVRIMVARRVATAASACLICTSVASSSDRARTLCSVSSVLSSRRCCISRARLTRASLLQVIREDHIRTARAKGLKERTVILRHALRNSLIPVVTVLGPLFAAVLTGTLVVEQIFGIPGMGPT